MCDRCGRDVAQNGIQKRFKVTTTSPGPLVNANPLRRSLTIAHVDETDDTLYLSYADLSSGNVGDAGVPYQNGDAAVFQSQAAVYARCAEGVQVEIIEEVYGCGCSSPA